MTTRWATTLLLFIFLCGAGAVATPPKVIYQQPNQALIPAYGPSYSATDDLLKQLLDEVKGLRKDVQSLKQGTGTSQQDALAVIGSQCVSCHKADVATDKGGGFVLVETDNSLSPLSLFEKKLILDDVKSGKMPKNGTLTDNEKKLLTDFFGQPVENQKK